MSEALVVLNNNAELAVGGIGVGSSLFEVKPATLEIVQRTSQQAGATPGRFRDTSNNQHYDTMEWVLLFEPVKQRAYYPKGAEMGKGSKLCFSLDNVQPSKYAKEPQQPFCATCPKGDWTKYRLTGDSKDVPPCKEYWHLLIADRATQMPFYFNVKGTSIAPFEMGMKNLARTLFLVLGNVKNENKKNGYKPVFNAKGGLVGFAPDPTYVLPTGQTERLPIVPMPNIFDVKFPVSITSETRKAGISYVLQVGPPTLMNAEARAEFGSIYADFKARKEAGKVQPMQEAAAETETDAAMTEAPARQEVAAVTGPITGEVVPKSDITI